MAPKMLCHPARTRPRHGFTATARIDRATGLIVAEAFAAAKPSLSPPPAITFRALLKLERCINKGGMVYLNGETELQPGQIVQAVVEHADEHDLWAVLA